MSILLERLQKKLQGDILSIRQDKQCLTWRLAKKAPFPKSGRAVLSVHQSSTFAPLQELADFFLRNYKDTCGKESTLFNLELLEIFSSYFKHFLKNFFSIDESYYCVTIFWEKILLIAPLMRNGQKRWFWKFFTSQSLHIICHKVWSIMLRNFSNKF